MSKPKIWHTPTELPGAECYIYVVIHSPKYWRVIGEFYCSYLGEFEMMSLDDEHEYNIPVRDIEKWAYIEDLESLS